MRIIAYTKTVKEGKFFNKNYRYFFVDRSAKTSIMSWTPDRDIIFCREILVSNIFATKKSSTERGKVWEAIADKLSDVRQPTFRVDQRSIRDHYNKLLTRFKRKMREERGASGISPEKNEVEVLLEEITEREEVAANEKENINEAKKRNIEEDKVAADDVRRKAMEKLSETNKRKAEEGDQNVKKKRRSSGNDVVSYLREKADMEREVKKEEMEVKKEEIERKKAEQELEKKRQEKQSEQQAIMFEQQNSVVKTMMEQHQQQQQQMQAMQVMMMQQQQQQNQA